MADAMIEAKSYNEEHGTAIAIRKIKYLNLSFPVKRAEFMPRRACHSVPLRPSAVCDGRAPRGGRARWGTAVCVGAQAAPHRRPHGPRRGPAVGFGVRSQQPGGRAGWGR